MDFIWTLHGLHGLHVQGQYSHRYPFVLHTRIPLDRDLVVPVILFKKSEGTLSIFLGVISPHSSDLEQNESWACPGRLNATMWLLGMADVPRVLCPPSGRNSLHRMIYARPLCHQIINTRLFDRTFQMALS